MSELKQVRTDGTLSFMAHDYPVIANQNGVQPRVVKKAGTMQSAGAADYCLRLSMLGT
jgi:hypothetical protein